MDHGRKSNAGRPERTSVTPGKRPDGRPHSADFLDEELRNDWWNQDFLALMGRRLRLEECHTVLDCGCGRGHWSRALAGTLPPDAVIVGVDKESAWIVDAAASSQRADLSHRFRFQQGFVEDLP